MNRRDFIKSTAIITASSLLPTVTKAEQYPPGEIQHWQDQQDNYIIRWQKVQRELNRRRSKIMAVISKNNKLATIYKNNSYQREALAKLCS